MRPIILTHFFCARIIKIAINLRMRLTPHRFFATNPVGVDWVCGDLHGEFDALQTALSEAGFNKAADRLFLLGDTIDRGPESRALLEWVLDTDWVYSVMGNHELMFIAGAEDNRNRYKHRGMGGDWATSLDETTYKNLATQCRLSAPGPGTGPREKIKPLRVSRPWYQATSGLPRLFRRGIRSGLMFWREPVRCR